jgi:hypothetical protein
MPFTFSHPAIVLPLTFLPRQWFSFTGLVIGFAIYKLPTYKTENENINLKYWVILAGLTLTIISIRLLSGLDFKQYGNEFLTAISAGLILLMLTPIILIKFNKQ